MPKSDVSDFGHSINERTRVNPSSVASGEREKRKKMTAAEVLDVARDGILTLILVASPLMLVALIVGVAISLLQALTQIQEMTLVFIPKILAIFLALLIALPFMGDVMQGYMARIAERIVAPG
jgi:flagellar biosynthetic protein FliQ